MADASPATAASIDAAFRYFISPRVKFHLALLDRTLCMLDRRRPRVQSGAAPVWRECVLFLYRMCSIYILRNGARARASTSSAECVTYTHRKTHTRAKWGGGWMGRFERLGMVGHANHANTERQRGGERKREKERASARARARARARERARWRGRYQRHKHTHTHTHTHTYTHHIQRGGGGDISGGVGDGIELGIDGFVLAWLQESLERSL